MQLKNRLEAWLMGLMKRVLVVELSSLRHELTHELLAHIGISDLARLVDEAGKNRGSMGHNDYNTLARVFHEIALERAISQRDKETSSKLENIRNLFLEELK